MAADIAGRSVLLTAMHARTRDGWMDPVVV